MNKLKLLFALITGITLSFPVAAKLYKWVDDNGTTHYGETVPPEYANSNASVLAHDRGSHEPPAGYTCTIFPPTPDVIRYVLDFLFLCPFSLPATLRS